MSDEHDEIMRKLKTLEFLIRDQAVKIETQELAIRKLVKESQERHGDLVMRLNTPVEWPDSLRDILKK